MDSAVLSKIKFITIFFLSLPMDVVQSQCSSSEFLTEDSHCCRICEPGYFITKNCTLRDSFKAEKCSECTGTEIVTNCTTFSDTKCDCGDGYTMSSPGFCDTVTTPTPTPTFSMSTNQETTGPSALAAYVHGPIAAVLLMTTLTALFLMFFYWLRKARKTDMLLKVPCQV